MAILVDKHVYTSKQITLYCETLRQVTIQSLPLTSRFLCSFTGFGISEQPLLSLRMKSTFGWKENTNSNCETHRFFVLPGSHSFTIDQKHMLTRIITPRGLVNQHQLTPAEKVPEVEFPRSSFLSPFLLNSHFMINLKRKYTYWEKSPIFQALH